MTGREELPNHLLASYEYCRKLHQRQGRTYYLATKLLPAAKRHHIHALYGFSRHTDDLVDQVDPAERTDVSVRAERLNRWRADFLEAVEQESEAVRDDPVLPAVIHTIHQFNLDLGDFLAFFRSMEMDLTVTEYPTYADLLEYMAGSAAAIGSMTMPILGTADPVVARQPARELGLAFQMTNFIRDVAEDLDLGRIYLPLEDLATCGVTREQLGARRFTPQIRALVARSVDRAREHYRRAAPGIPMLSARSQPCIRAAFAAYGGILDEVVRADYNVFARRATVPTRRKLGIVAGSLLTRPGQPLNRIPGGTTR